MNAEALEARRRYRRKWAKANPDKIRAQQMRYWMKKARETANLTADQDAPDKEPATT